MKRYLLAAFAAITLACSCTENCIDFLIGTYTGSGSWGIYRASLCLDDGRAVLTDSAGVVNPSYICMSPDGRTAYTVRETSDEKAGVYCFAIEGGSMTALGFQLTGGPEGAAPGVPADKGGVTGGEDPCFLETDGRVLVTANYSGGSMTVFPVLGNGDLGEASAIFPGSTGGPDTTRQNTAHVHCTKFSPDGGYIFASDFSADRILRFEVLEDATVRQSLDGEGKPLCWSVSADSGPRHITFSPDGNFMYVIGELSGGVTAFRYNDGRLEFLQEVDADPCDGRGSADIHISPDGNFLYASNRLVGDCISIFRIAADGTLSPAGTQSVPAHPRQFSITPDGRWLLCCCRDADSIVIYHRNAKTGALTEQSRLRLSKPVCVTWM
ncbi:MAG: lactonase family protein [Bacteroidales bacterium]|nr:lactonase family protein [Bacteroidales bacterium]